jgi:hypothetical protein
LQVRVLLRGPNKKNKDMNEGYPQTAVFDLPEGFEIVGWGIPNSPHKGKRGIWWDSAFGWVDVSRYQFDDPQLLYAIKKP